MDYFYSAKFCSDLGVVKESVEVLIDELSEIINSEDVALEVKIILNELLINGVLHGNQSCRDKFIKLALKVNNGQLQLSVQDEGDGIIPCSDIDDDCKLKSCGRGLLIVRNLTDAFIVEKSTITVKKFLK